ncbi:MAG: NUDIX domain-containing protein [Planktomarina sp.]
MQRFGHPPKSGQTYIRRPGVYAILPMDGGVLLTFQGGNHNELQLPGGGIDPGENPLTALHREVNEETGWRIARPQVFGRYKRFTFMPEYDIWAEKICTIYIADPIYPLGAPTEDFHEAVWMPFDDAVAQLDSTGDAAMLSEFVMQIR